MEFSKRDIGIGVVVRQCVLVLLVAISLAGCASLNSARTGSEAERTIWRGRDQFVKVVPQERGGGIPAVVNDHPASVSPAEIRHALASVEVMLPGMDAPAPLFSATELKVLEDAGARALNQAAPSEDVVFAVFGYDSALQGILKETKVTTGRMFYQDGRLNLILGLVRQAVMENEDRRLNPFIPGSRHHPTAISGQIRGAGGVPYTLKRQDWLVFAPAASVPAATEAVKTAPEPVPAAVVPVGSPRASATDGVPSSSTSQSIEERLILLNNLKQKGLITEEELRAKRMKILDEL